MREISRHVRQFGQKLTPENINNFGQKALHMGRVMGRKMSNSISKIENVANAALPIASKLRPWQATQSSALSHQLETV